MFRRMRTVVAAMGVAAMSIHTGAGPAWAAKGDAAGTALPKEERRALEHTLATVFESLPQPEKGFRLDKKSKSTEIGYSKSAQARKAQAPAEATGIRVYEKTGAGKDAETTTLEVRVYVNRERSLPEPLGSEGGALEAFTLEGMQCTRASLAGVTPGRVALPLTPEQEENALTVLRAYIAPPGVESYLGDIAKGRSPEATPWDGRPAARPSEVRTIVVEYYGPKAEVERLLHATPPGSLRALLTL